MLIIGHRGLPREFPDNSLAGILAARFCDMVEIDVRRTRDGVLVLSHDPHFASRLLVESDWCDLERLRSGGHPLARLEELLEAVGDFPLNLEIKQSPADADFDPTFSVARRTAALARPGDLVTCFHWETMQVLRREFPRMRTGLLVDRGWSLIDAIERAVRDGHHAVAAHDSLLVSGDPRVAPATVTDHGLELFVWTVNKVARAAALAGVTGIITDVPRTMFR